MGNIFVILLLLHKRNSSLSFPLTVSPFLSQQTIPSAAVKLNSRFSRRWHPLDF